MTASTGNHSTPPWLRTLRGRGTRYRRLFGWPVRVDTRHRTLTLTAGDTVDALTMPSGLGTMVRDELSIALQCGPIVADQDGTAWTFLTMPAGFVRPLVTADLATLRVRLLPRGYPVPIPADRTVTTGPVIRWINAPTLPAPLPPAHPVIAVVRRLNNDSRLPMAA